MSFLVFIVIVGIIALLVAASCIKIVPQAYAIVRERLGASKTTWNTGIHFKMPFIERVARKVNLKQRIFWRKQEKRITASLKIWKLRISVIRLKK